MRVGVQSARRGGNGRTIARPRLRAGSIVSVRAVVFDLFGTLVHNLDPEGYGACVGRMASALGVAREAFEPRWRATFRARMDGSLRDGPDMFRPILAEIGVAADEERLHAADRERAAFLRAGLQPKDDAVACLEALRGAGYRLAMATDCSSGTPEMLAAMPLGAFFEVTAASALVGVTKPDARMYRHVLDGLGVPGDRCLYVGDGNSRELPGAKAHGMTTVWVDNGDRQHWRHEFDPTGDLRVTSLIEIPALVRTLGA
jgi:putative hydrolase of the HAD superfamily